MDATWTAAYLAPPVDAFSAFGAHGGPANWGPLAGGFFGPAGYCASAGSSSGCDGRPKGPLRPQR